MDFESLKIIIDAVEGLIGEMTRVNYSQNLKVMNPILFIVEYICRATESEEAKSPSSNWSGDLLGRVKNFKFPLYLQLSPNQASSIIQRYLLRLRVFKVNQSLSDLMKWRKSSI